MGLLVPDEYVTDIHAIDLDALAGEGVRALLVDLDNTLTPRNSDTIPGETVEWAARVRDAGFAVCLVSNNWHERVAMIAGALGFELVTKSLKPFPFAFHKAFRLLGVDAAASAVVGDQIFTDILGGNLVGAKTVLVEPLAGGGDLPHTMLLRRLEARILSGREPRSGVTSADGG
jgi:HAD superfamily phosphatase (TIGR01668 family)